MSIITNFILTMKETVLSNDLMGAAFYLSLMTGAWYYAKGILPKVWGKITHYFVYTAYFDERSAMCEYFDKWLKENYSSKFRNVEIEVFLGDSRVDKSSGGDERPVESEEAKEKKEEYRVVQKQKDYHFIIWHNNYPLKVSCGREKIENANSFWNMFLRNYTVKGFFAKKKINQLLDHIVSLENNKLTEETEVLYNSDRYWNTLTRKEFRKPETVIFKKGVKEQIISYMDKFITNKEWYAKRAVPYKLGIMFHGPPGNGKTSIIQALSRKYQRPIYSLNLMEDNIKDGDLTKLFSKIPKNAILVIEDIDALFNGDKRQLKSRKLSFSALLNCLDGLYSTEGVITLFTTNKEKQLDEALVRPGRMDLSILIDNPDLDQVKRYYKIFFDKELKIKKLSKVRSMAEIQGIFSEHKNDSETVSDLL